MFGHVQVFTYRVLTNSEDFVKTRIGIFRLLTSVGQQENLGPHGESNLSKFNKSTLV